jgi:hypothetical protein
VERQRVGKRSAALLPTALLLASTLWAPLSHAQGTEREYVEKLHRILMAQNKVWEGTGFFVAVGKQVEVPIPHSPSGFEK